MKLLALSTLLILWSCSNTTESPQDKKSSTTVAKNFTDESSATTADKSGEKFKTFFQRFSKDSSFQRTRIVFPIKVSSTDGKKEEMRLINKQDWTYTDYSNLKAGRISIEKVNNELINLIYTVEDTGVLVYHYFQKTNKKWMLVSIKDHST